MAKRMGGDLSFTVGATVLTAARGWSLEDEDVTVDSTAAGDAVVDRDSLRGDYTVEWDTLLGIAATYVIPNTVRGTKVAWAGRLVAAETGTGFVSSTGLCTRFRIEAAYDDAVKCSGTIKAAGVALLWDLTQ